MIYLAGIPIGLINGFFGSGGGIAAVFMLEKFLKTEEKKAHATAVFIILPLCAASLFMYGESLKGNADILLWASLGGVAGGILGAKLLKKMPKKWLKVLFGVIMAATGLRMVIA